MKILHVIRDLAITTGGPVTALRGLAEAQAALGHEVTVLSTDRRDVPTAELKNVRLRTVPALSGSWSWSHAFAGALERLMPHADFVHLHMVWDYPIWAAARSANRHGKPFILRPCGQLDRWSLSQKQWKKRAYLRLFGPPLRKAAAIHFTTEGERDSCRGVTGRAPCFVIPIGISENAYRDLPPRTAFAERFPELAGRRIVLFLGRLHPKKQPDLLIDAFARIAPAFEGLHLVLAGPAEGQYLERLRARTERLGIADRTTFTGTLSGVPITEAYRAAEVFALPSLQENFGISIVEAMAAGCPVLVSDRLNLATQIEAVEAGLIRPASVEEFAAALRTLIGDGMMRERMGANGHRLVIERYTWEPIARATVEAYQALMADARWR
jgi:glycosyltransferase involved in cell wall biosynthesis